MQRGLRKGSAGPALKLAYQNGPGAGAGLAAGGTGSCMRPPQNLSNMCMSVLGLSQTWRLKTAEVYSVSLPDARSLKARCHLGHSSSQVSRGDSFPASPSTGWLQSLLSPWLQHSNPCLSFHGLLFCLFLFCLL